MSTKTGSQDSGIEDVDDLLSVYLNGEDRAELNTKVFRGNWREVEGYETAEDAVGKIVFDVSWYTNYNVRMVGDVLRMSAYEPGQHYNHDRLADWVREAFEEQDGRHFGDDQS